MYEEKVHGGRIIANNISPTVTISLFHDFFHSIFDYFCMSECNRLARVKPEKTPTYYNFLLRLNVEPRQVFYSSNHTEVIAGPTVT